MAAWGHVEFAKHFAEVIVDGARADEQLGGSFRVGRAAGGQRRDPGFLGREVIAGLGTALTGVSLVATSSSRVRSAKPAWGRTLAHARVCRPRQSRAHQASWVRHASAN